MCYSAEVNKELNALMKRFKATHAIEAHHLFERYRMQGHDLSFVKEALNLKRKPSSEFFKEPGADNRIYPGYFTWVMVQENGKNVFKKMRYRVRPNGSTEEIPSKFNVFNARVDSLEERQTWKKLFTKQHGIFPFTRFYEWVEHEGVKRQISFAPANRDIMWAPCLWDYWENTKGNFGFYSFALITDDPPEEVLRMGHDRCPIFMQENLMNDWLNVNLKKEEYYQILKAKEQVYFENKWAA